MLGKWRKRKKRNIDSEKMKTLKKKMLGKWRKRKKGEEILEMNGNESARKESEENERKQKKKKKKGKKYWE